MIGLNDQGQIVSFKPGTNAQVQALGTPGPGNTFVTGTAGIRPAFSINDRNLVVGRGVVNGGFTGFVSFNGYAVDLNTLVNLNGLGINATTIRGATAINDRGQIVVRAGNTRTDGYAIVLTPVPGTSQFTPRRPSSQTGNVSTFIDAASGE